MNHHPAWNAISQCAEKILGQEEILKKLSSHKPLRVKFGVDPTKPDLTFGHWVQFSNQRMGKRT